MIIKNIKYYEGIGFDEYAKLPGVSFSGLKGEEIIPTPGMQLGTRVHNYINEPDKYDWQQPEIVRPISEALRKYLGDSFLYLKREISFTADFIHNEMLLKYKGRADLVRVGRLVIDLKILSGNVDAAIKMFHYDRQISGYCLATGAALGIILAYNKNSKKVETKIIKPDAAFWEYQCVHRGEPLTYIVGTL